MSESQVMIVVGVPPEHVDTLLDAISNAGGGIIGNYTHCAYTNTGQGRFKPSEEANPHIGTKQAINAIDEISHRDLLYTQSGKGSCGGYP